MTGFPPDHGEAEVRASPNFGKRRDGLSANALILHYTGMASGTAAEDWLCDPRSEVSSHYLVHEDGRIVQMVGESDRAWHAGRGSWKGVSDVNSFSIGIEIVNPGHNLGYPDFPDVQMDAVTRLCRDIVGRYRIVPERVLAHSDVAPRRKIDPGEKFPWARLAAHGVGHFVAPHPIDHEARDDGARLRQGDRGAAVEELQSMLSSYGYEAGISGVYDGQTIGVVEAFQRHFRPRCVDGIADRSTIETLRALASALKNGGCAASPAR